MTERNLTHEHYMRRCTELARQATETGDAQVGALVVLHDRIVGEGVEAVRAARDVTAHAEIEALRAATRSLGSTDLTGSTMYTSVEPCVMCAFAVRLARVSVVVAGARSSDVSRRLNGWAVLSRTDILPDRPVPTTIRDFSGAGRTWPALAAPLDRPEHVPVAFVEAWNRRDADGIAALFDADAEFVNVTGLWWHDREAIRRAHAYGLARIFDRSTLRLGATRVKHLSNDVVVVHARMTLSGQTATGDVACPGTRTTIFSFVVHRTPDGWRCASAHNTDVVPGMETNVVDEEGRLRAVDYRKDG